jgi:putative transposase
MQISNIAVPPKNIRLRQDQYTGVRLYFVTVCCHKRRSAFENSETACSAIEILRETASHHRFEVHAYCFMPDHLHILAEGATHQSNLIEFVHRFKQSTAFAYRQKYCKVLWQSRFYDHILRFGEAVHDVAWYVWLNPVRQGLCRNPYDYPFSGSLSFSWKSEESRNVEKWVPPWKLAMSKSNAAG